MKLAKLKELIDGAVERAGDCDPDVEIYTLDDSGPEEVIEEYYIVAMGQFGVIPDVTIQIAKVSDEEG